MLSFNITVTGLDKALSYLDNYKDLLKDLTPEFDTIGDWWISFEENNVWESEGGAIDENWSPLSDNYLSWKNKNYPGRGILERTGTLRYGFEKRTSSESLILLNATEYGVYLQYGTDKMPARVFMKLAQEQLSIIRDMMITSLEDRAKNL